MGDRITRRAAMALGVGTLAAVASPVSPSRATASAPVVAKLGAYEFPPYVDEDGGGVTRGLIDLLNNDQSDFRFEMARTSPQRRYEDLQTGRFDLIAFESAAWGWRGLPVDASRVFFTDAEVFVAKAGPGVDQHYFDDVTGKTILGRLGYHYAFAGYNADPAALEARHHTRLTVSHEGNLRSVAAGRADLAIVTRSFLIRFLRANPEFAKRLLVSERTDQIYEHTILVRRGGPVTVGWVNATLDRLDAENALSILWSRFGIVA